MRAVVIVILTLAVAVVLWGQLADGAAVQPLFPDARSAGPAAAEPRRGPRPASSARPTPTPAPAPDPTGSRLTRPTALLLGLAGLGLVVLWTRRLRV